MQSKKIFQVSLIFSIIFMTPEIARAHLFSAGEILLFLMIPFFMFVFLILFLGALKYFLITKFIYHGLPISRWKAFATITLELVVYFILLSISAQILLILFRPEMLSSISDNLTIYLITFTQSHPFLSRYVFASIAGFPLFYFASWCFSAFLLKKNITGRPNLLHFSKLAAIAAFIIPVSVCLVLMLATVRSTVSYQQNKDKLLISAVSDGNLVLVRSLINTGTDINAKDDSGYPVLYRAFAFGIWARSGEPIDTINFLLEYGADVNAVQDKSGMSVVMSASAGHGRLEEFKSLLNRKPDLMHYNKEGKNALFYAIETRQFDKAELLINYGMDINKIDIYDNSPLIDAIKRNETETVRFLVGKGVNLNREDNNGMTALQYAERLDRKEIIELLTKHGARSL